MKRAFAAVLCCAVLLAVAHADTNEKGLGSPVEVAEVADPPETAPADGEDTDEDGADASDDDGDSAPFTLVVEHADGWCCSASLVSLRTAVTSAKCARGPSPATPAGPAGPVGHAARPADLWVHAPPVAAPHSSRRVVRIAFAAESETAEGSEASAADLAVLELEAALGSGVRAILMATSGAECSPPAACHVVRARRRPGSARVRLRIADEALVPPHACAALQPRAAPRRDLLCMRGDPLCPSEWGAGVVCEGKLCGAVSVSGAGVSRGGCGALSVAAAAPRWRRFLHCAHSAGACSRGGECAHMCSERRLLDDESGPGPASPALPAPPEPRAAALDYSDTTAEDRPTPPHRTSDITETIKHETLRTSSRIVPARTSPPPAPPSPSPAASPPSVRPAAEFEPNRPDFKAGEYGDNAAEYGGDEPATSPPPASETHPPPSRTPPPAAPAPPAPRELSARVSAEAPLKSASGAARLSTLILLFVYFSI